MFVYQFVTLRLCFLRCLSFVHMFDILPDLIPYNNNMVIMDLIISYMIYRKVFFCSIGYALKRLCYKLSHSLGGSR